MKLNELYAVLDSVAPKRLSDEYCAKYGAYDNSGVLVNTGKEIQTVLFSLDFSAWAVQKAEEIGAELIVTHHPAIYQKLGALSVEEPLGEKLLACVQKGISVVSMHLNLDLAPSGTDEALEDAVCKACDGKSKRTVLMHEVEGGGYGRAYDLPFPISLEKLSAGLQKELKSANISVFGKNHRLCRAASFCGGGASEESILFAAQKGADVIVSADFKHHLIAEAIERGIAVIAPTHYATERYGFKKYYQKISRGLKEVSCVFHEDKFLL